MGREIRRVPLNWEHPRTHSVSSFEYRPLYNSSYKEAANEWLYNATQWEVGIHPDLSRDPELKKTYPYWWDYDSLPPCKSDYRPEWTEENPPIGYQIYETVSEGTPISPVFPSEESMKIWLLDQGYEEKTVDVFIKEKWCPSFILKDGIFYSDIDSCREMDDKTIL